MHPQRPPPIFLAPMAAMIARTRFFMIKLIDPIKLIKINAHKMVSGYNYLIYGLSIRSRIFKYHKAITMKIRIKGNSIRIRLTRTEVAKLCEEGIIRESTQFPSGSFTYEVVLTEKQEMLHASFEDNCIRFYLPKKLSENWPDNEIVGFEEWLSLANDNSLHLLLEKDFQCLEVRSEDESDQYPNPKAIL